MYPSVERDETVERIGMASNKESEESNDLEKERLRHVLRQVSRDLARSERELRTLEDAHEANLKGEGRRHDVELARKTREQESLLKEARERFFFERHGSGP